VNNDQKIIAFLRHKEGGPNDHVLIVANFSATPWEAYEVGVPAAGVWSARFNSDWEGYRSDLENFPVQDVVASADERDGQPAKAVVAVAAYSLSIYCFSGG
jgi:1,4-alpha-glucan branching enzyme